MAEPLALQEGEQKKCNDCGRQVGVIYRNKDRRLRCAWCSQFREGPYGEEGTKNG